MITGATLMTSARVTPEVSPMCANATTRSSRGEYRKRPVEERFWEKVAIRDARECWLWISALDHYGYGQFSTHHGACQKVHKAHKFAWEYLNGAVPAGLELDHLCRVRACVNPWHLEAVTHRVNSQRGDWSMNRRPRAKRRPQEA